MKKIIVFATLALCMFLSTAVSNSAQQIVNGSFEEGIAIPDSWFVRVSGGDSSSILGWSTGTDNIDYIGGLWEASDGNRSLDLEGAESGGAGQISQTFTTIPGVTYEISFDISGNPDGGIAVTPSLKRMTVGATGGLVTEYSYLLGLESRRDNMLWQSKKYKFIATSESTVLTFTSTTGTGYGIALDNVAIFSAYGEICHQNSGKKGEKTIIVGVSAVAPHLANHEDYSGPCRSGQ